MTRTLLLASLALGVVGATDEVLAAPVADPQLAALKKQIAAARRADARTFSQIAALKARLPELDRRKRGRMVAVAPPLRALGSRAFWPMVEELTAAPPTTWTETARRAWRVGLLEAIGALRDGRARVVLQHTLRTETDGPVVRAAAAALGNLGDDEAVRFLVEAAAQPGAGRLHVLAGFGACRRLAAAQFLAAQLEANPSEDDAVVLVRALGELGSAWAWETPRLAGSSEGLQVRALAAQSLLAAFVREGGEVRRAAETALLLVDEQQMPARIAAAKTGAAPALKAELERLAKRLASSPLRPRGPSTTKP